MKNIFVCCVVALCSDRLLSQTGNVGIGTTSPLYKLDVNDTINSNAYKIKGRNAIVISGLNLGQYSNLFIGDGAGLNNTANDNVFIGSFGGVGNTTGRFNTLVGNNTMTAVNTGNQNTGLGSYVFFNNGTGSDGTAVGYNALAFNSSGSSNTAMGSQALSFNIAGHNNTAVGLRALRNNDGTFNTAVGVHAMEGNFTGTGNSVLGGFALGTASASNHTAAIGYAALYNLQSGNFNTAIGSQAAFNTMTGTLHIALGFSAGTTGGNFNNTISIGNENFLNASSNQAFLGNLNIVWTGGNTGWSTWSDERVKKNIHDDVIGLDFIQRLRPVTYYRDNSRILSITGNKDSIDYPGKGAIEEIKFSGFLAQEVERAALESGYNFHGYSKPKNEQQLYTLSYESFVVPLVKAVQEQQAIIEKLQQQVSRLEKKLNDTPNH